LPLLLLVEDAIAEVVVVVGFVVGLVDGPIVGPVVVVDVDVDELNSLRDDAIKDAQSLVQTPMQYDCSRFHGLHVSSSIDGFCGRWLDQPAWLLQL